MRTSISIQTAALSLALALGEGTTPAQTAPGIEQRSEGGGVTVSATYLGRSGETIRFQVKLDTHSADLSGFDLKNSVALRNDGGTAVRPMDPRAVGGHHAEGELAFPATDSNGRAVAGDGAQYLELVVLNLAGIPERVLRWDLR